jgi:peptidoglycan/LPS O-acetylase OafA/YrhL
MKNKISNLESLRGFAALTVAMFHFQIGTLLTNNSFVDHGDQAVSFFFVLSGFVIAENYFEKLNNFSHVLKFQIKRFWRLYPVHLFVLVLYVFVELAKLYFIEYSDIKPTEKAFDDDQSLISFIKSIFLFQNILDNEFVWNRPAWSISVEFYTYLLFALLIVLFKKNSIFIFILITGYFYLSDIITINILINSNINLNFLGSHFKTCINAFSLGVVINYIYQKSKNIRINEIFCWISLLAVILIMSNYRTTLGSLQIGNKFINTQILYSSFGILIILTSLVKNDSYYSKILNFKFFQFLGKISYSFYMIHFLIVYLITQILRFVFKVDFIYTENGTAAKLQLLKSEAYVVTFVYLTISVIASHYMYKFIENRYRK